jgi:hypothetical protein
MGRAIGDFLQIFLRTGRRFAPIAASGIYPRQTNKPADRSATSCARRNQLRTFGRTPRLDVAQNLDQTHDVSVVEDPIEGSAARTLSTDHAHARADGDAALVALGLRQARVGPVLVNPLERRGHGLAVAALARVTSMPDTGRHRMC